MRDGSARRVHAAGPGGRRAYPIASYPNDGDGSDHDSLGLFQMRPPEQVGTPLHGRWSDRCGRPAPSTAAQQDGPNHGSPAGLLDITGWQQLSLGAAAQAVEVSEYPERYAVNEPVAEKIAAALTGVTLSGEAGAQCPAASTTPANLPPGFAGKLIAAAEKEIGLPYVWGGGTYTGPSGQATDGQGPGFDCSGLVMYAAYQASGGAIRLAHYTGDQVDESQERVWWRGG